MNHITDINVFKCEKLLRLIVSRPVCRREALEIYPDWFRISKLITARKWDQVAERSSYFVDHKIDLWSRKCRCGRSKCIEYWADPVLIQPSIKLTIQPLNNQDLFEYEYHSDGDSAIKVTSWTYGKEAK